MPKEGESSKTPRSPTSKPKTKKKKKPTPKTREQLIKDWSPRPRPPVTETPSFNRLEQYDYVREVTKKNVWYYRDRLSVPRGPCTLPVLRDCWVNGVIDENTLLWGQGLIDWLPAKNIRTLVAQIRSPEGERSRVRRSDNTELCTVRFSTWFKKQFALKPALAEMRRRDPEKRQIRCDQVDDMF